MTAVPRSNRPRRGRRATSSGAPAQELDLDRALGGMARRVSGPDGDWLVRPVAGPAASKTYRCPGCDQEISVGVPHVVAWPADTVTGSDAALADRRHWHSACWSARGRRSARPPRPGRAGRH